MRRKYKRRTFIVSSASEAQHHAAMPTRVELASVEVVGSNPSPFNTPITLRIILHVLEKPPQKKVDVKFTWSPIWDFPVDQELDELEVGPFSTLGKHVCVLECDPPSLAGIPDPTGPTAMMVSFQYDGKEFLHLGFNIETTCLLPETPEEYTDGSVLSRKIGRCFRKMSDIPWDDALSESAAVLSADDIVSMAAAGVGQNRRPATGDTSDEDYTDSDEDDDDDDVAAMNAEDVADISSRKRPRSDVDACHKGREMTC